MAGIGWERPQAVACLTTLMQLMQCEGLSVDQVSEIQVMLARMQGVRQLSALLCPIFGDSEDTETCLGMLSYSHDAMCVVYQSSTQADHTQSDCKLLHMSSNRHATKRL